MVPCHRVCTDSMAGSEVSQIRTPEWGTGLPDLVSFETKKLLHLYETPEEGYMADIMAHLRRREQQLRPLPHYLSLQNAITAQMRYMDVRCCCCIACDLMCLVLLCFYRQLVVDWVVDVHLDLQLHHETLFVTINLFDRVLSRVHCMPKNLQRLMCSCLLVACKVRAMLLTSRCLQYSNS